MSIGPRSGPLQRLSRLFRIGAHADARGICSAEAIELARERGPSRRGFIGGVAAVSAIAVTRRAWAAPKPPPSIDVGIVGAGLAGLQCAYELGRAGLSPTLYEAASRVGGRQFSLRDKFPSQVAERGGELRDVP